MIRFIVRNYGITRQVQHKGQQIIIANDKAIETDNMDLVATLQNYSAMHVTDRCPETPGPSLPPVVLIEDEQQQDEQQDKQQDEQQVEEIAYSDMKVGELQELGKDRQIKVSGLKKADLIEALENYDKEEAEEKPQEETPAKEVEKEITV